MFEFDGYGYATAKEMDLAKKEAVSIAYIKSRTDFKDREKLKKLYEGLIEKQSFVTPTGINFLREIQKELNAFSDKTVSPVFVTVPTYMKKGAFGRSESFQQMSEDQKQGKKDILQGKLRNLRIINAFLILIIIGMFVSVLLSNNSPFTDAEVKIQNKYSAWEKELSERENAILEKEQELLQQDKGN